jgi:hypothetical protein
LLPATTLASLVGMFRFLTVKGWWRYAHHRTALGVGVPCPGGWTLMHKGAPGCSCAAWVRCRVGWTRARAKTYRGWAAAPAPNWL